jgi:O-antigen/teichoic acid export membrane protein
VENPSEIIIDKKDVIWNYLATFLQIGSGVLLFPIILKMLPSETLGIWSIFVAITGLINLLDFGFSPSFTRNITYIFSGVDVLKATGISSEKPNVKVNYNLLANTIRAMKWFYSRMAFSAFVLLITAGSYYLFYVLTNNFRADKTQIYIAWILFCFINTYNIYTLYYDSLMMGRGLVMKSKQFIIVSQLAYLIVSVVLIINGFGLISIVAGQAISVIIRRLLSNRFFFTPDLKIELGQIKTENFRDIVKVITPNSIKVGLTNLGAFLVLQSSVIIGSLYISLEKLASYGITVQVVNVISSLASVYYLSYLPKVANLRVQNNLSEIKKIYFKCITLMILTYIGCGIALLIFGNWGLTLLKSQTFLLSNIMIFIILLISFLEKNHAIAGGFLLTKNEVPYFKAAIISGIATIIILFILIKIAHLEVWGMILAPGIVQFAYQNWKWPVVLIKELNVKV